MFPSSYFKGNFYPARYFPHIGGAAAPAPPGVATVIQYLIPGADFYNEMVATVAVQFLDPGAEFINQGAATGPSPSPSPSPSRVCYLPLMGVG